jgi:hypothetical protein
MEILDGCALYGRPAAPVGAPCVSPNELLADMDRLGIAECWCADWRALENSAALGNRLLGEELSGQPRLHPVWVVLPPGTGEVPEPPMLLAALARAGVSMVRAEPERHGYSIADWSMGELWSALECCRVPVLLDPAGRWDQLDALAAQHPGLPLVLTNLTYRLDRVLYPLLARHPNLHLETSGYLGNEGLAELAARFGPGRAIFGTGSPVIAPEAALGTLRFSGLSAADQAAVGNTNLQHLLAEARTRLTESAP